MLYSIGKFAKESRIYGLRKYKKEINLDNEIKDESL